jgi:hypothetical protein
MKSLTKLWLLVAAFGVVHCAASAQTAATGAGGRNPYIPIQIITNCDMSTTACTSLPVNIQSYANVGIQFIWTGAPTGLISVQVSQNGPTGTYTALTLTPTEPSGSAGMWYLDAQTNAQYIEAVYTKTSGTGNLNVYLGAK